MPISFIDRAAGESKMSIVIVVEAFGLVTWWALGRLARGLRAALGGRRGTGPTARRPPTERDRRRRHGRVRRAWRGDMTLDTPPARILVVDDEPNIAELLSAALSFEGYQVGVAATGAEALEQVRSFRPNLVMLDVMLPDFDGNEVCRRLRNQGEQVPDRLPDRPRHDPGQGRGPQHG